MKIIDEEEPADLVRRSHHDWYRELFKPSVAAGLISVHTRLVPPRWESVADAMATVFELHKGEREGGVKAVLGHWLLGFVHPYPGGNGRIARFLMNAMQASGGYPWTVIRIEDRIPYLTALDSASVDQEIGPFA